MRFSSIRREKKKDGRFFFARTKNHLVENGNLVGGEGNGVGMELFPG